MNNLGDVLRLIGREGRSSSLLRERYIEEALRGSAKGIRNPRFINRKEYNETSYIRFSSTCK